MYEHTFLNSMIYKVFTHNLPRRRRAYTSAHHNKRYTEAPRCLGSAQRSRNSCRLGNKKFTQAVGVCITICRNAYFSLLIRCCFLVGGFCALIRLSKGHRSRRYAVASYLIHPVISRTFTSKEPKLVLLDLWCFWNVLPRS